MNPPTQLEVAIWNPTSPETLLKQVPSVDAAPLTKTFELHGGPKGAYVMLSSYACNLLGVNASHRLKVRW